VRAASRRDEIGSDGDVFEAVLKDNRTKIIGIRAGSEDEAETEGGCGDDAVKEERGEGQRSSGRTDWHCRGSSFGANEGRRCPGERKRGWSETIRSRPFGRNRGRGAGDAA